MQRAPADSGHRIVLSPTLGRPAFAEPGERLRIVAHLPEDARGPEFHLTRGGARPMRIPLEIEGAELERLRTGGAAALRVPPRTLEGTYDLELRWAGGSAVEPHCVAVARVGRDLRIVHLSNINIGDRGAPEFDPRLIDEINLLAPTLIVATGDYVDATCENPAAAWRRLVECFRAFDAPIVLACGDHDDFALYSQYVAPSPVGLTAVGPHRVLTLLDHGLAPIAQDAEQLRWIDSALAIPGFDGLTVVLAHSEFPGLLREWQQRGVLSRMIQSGHLALWFAGGHRDWDGREYRELIDAAAPLLYLRTQQSSSAVREGASGVSHYRIVDVSGNRVYMPADAATEPGVPPSLPTGRLSANVRGRNDASESVLTVSAVNNHPFRLDGLAVRLRLRKEADAPPWCHGGRIERLADAGDAWEFRVRFDLPDKGAARIVAGVGPEPPGQKLAVGFELAAVLRARRQYTSDGVSYLTAANTSTRITVTNTGTAPAEVSPLVRLDGDLLAYHLANSDGPYLTARPLRLEPGQAAALQLDLSALRVAPGRRELQVYLPGDAAEVPACYPLEVRIED